MIHVEYQKNKIKMVQSRLPEADHSIPWTCVQIWDIKQTEHLHYSLSLFVSSVK